MPEQVQWGNNLAAGLRQAAVQDRPVLLEFFTYGCEGCARLDAETYTEPRVIATLNGEFVPVSLNADASPEEAREFYAVWTPVLFVLDARGKVQYRFEGFLPPDEFVPLLLTAKMVSQFHQRRFTDAVDLARQMQEEHPASRFLPEVLYYLGAALLLSGDHDGSAIVWRQLQRGYAQSLWALRLPWRDPERAAA